MISYVKMSLCPCSKFDQSSYFIIESDASKFGWGAIFQDRWLQGQWPASMVDLDIQILESLAAFFAWLGSGESGSFTSYR